MNLREQRCFGGEIGFKASEARGVLFLLLRGFQFEITKTGGGLVFASLKLIKVFLGCLKVGRLLIVLRVEGIESGLAFFLPGFGLCRRCLKHRKGFFGDAGLIAELRGFRACGIQLKASVLRLRCIICFAL